MENPLLVSVKCLECGAPVKYPEGAYTFKCIYCGSVLRIKKRGIDLKYIIRSHITDEEIRVLVYNHLSKEKAPSRKISHITKIKTFYKPFWYFKGMIYFRFLSKERNEVLGKTWYYSFQANTEFLKSFNSLSVRTEILTIEPFDMEVIRERCEILPVSVKKEEAQRYAEGVAAVNFQYETGPTLYNELDLIGEHFFIIYFPVIQVICSSRAGLFSIMIDGIGKSLMEVNDRGGYLLSADEKPEEDFPYNIELLAHRCKNCGYDLHARDFDVIFYCNNCSRLWLLKGGEYQPVKIAVIETEKEDTSIFFPFWEFEVIIHSNALGIEIKTLRQLSTFMKLGRYMLRNEELERPVRLYCPAMITRNARALLKLVTRINIHQKPLPIKMDREFPYLKVLNVSLLDDEAKQMLKTITFALIGRQDGKAIDFYRDFSIEITKSILVWYPFEEKGDFLVDNFFQYNFQKKSMEIMGFMDSG